MNTSLLFTALTVGFLGSLHCAGMCGPIMLILPFRFLTGWKKAVAITGYHFARISVYAGMALILHSFKELFQPQWQRYIAIALGVILLIAGAFSFLPLFKLKMHLPWQGFVAKQTAKVIGRTSLLSMTVAGLLNGLLPCGLVYMALSLSVTTSSVWMAVLCMYLFGLGTMPMLLFLVLLGGSFRFLATAHMRRAVPLLLLAFGSLFMLRGMNLGIPYLSPGVTVQHQTIKSSCCHPN